MFAHNLRERMSNKIFSFDAHDEGKNMNSLLVSLEFWPVLMHTMREKI
jgi:hypothetical protein